MFQLAYNTYKREEETSPIRKRANGLWALTLFALASLALAACSASVSIGSNPSIGPRTISQSQLESRLATQLAQRAHQPVPTVTCPGPLAPKVGAKTNCTLKPQGSNVRYSVRVVIYSVKNGQALWHATVGNTPIQG